MSDTRTPVDDDQYKATERHKRLQRRHKSTLLGMSEAEIEGIGHPLEHLPTN
jgi:hypothetical protein